MKRAIAENMSNGQKLGMSMEFFPCPASGERIPLRRKPGDMEMMGVVERSSSRRKVGRIGNPS
jgi:hypothetical protein